jgi:hypothetical protein
MDEKKIEIESSLPIKSLVLGVRYEPQYRVGDSVGAVVDSILHAAGSPYDPNFFPLSNTSPVQQELFNPDSRDKLRINQSDTILELDFSTKDLKDIVQLAKDFNHFVLGPLHKISGLSRILRYGIVARFQESGTEALQRPTQRYADRELPKPRDMAVRFSYRLPTEEGFSRKSVSDYRNLIFNIFENDSGKVALSFDYQKYFSPMLEASEIASHPFPAFVEDAIHYHRTDFAKWIDALKRFGKAA